MFIYYLLPTQDDASKIGTGSSYLWRNPYAPAKFWWGEIVT